MRIEDYSIDTLKTGFYYERETEIFSCIHCNEKTVRGVIYKSTEGDLLLDAERKMKEHILDLHENSFQALVNLNKRSNGLSDSQKRVLEKLFQGYSDNEIAKSQGTESATVRQHRFKLKEKAKQAKVFLAMMELLEEKPEQDILTDIHKGATMVDDRWIITVEEEQKIRETYIDEKTGIIKQFPSKEKRKIVILKYLLSFFNEGVSYTEKEVNEKIKNYYSDFVTIRRYFIEYGFMDRSRDGSSYWMKK
ncbi:DUF2087 domain-containing protein [Evansella sp. AB-rgal1]|uniref:DUF2087 domain-containing protein n=1 Tax=Evansella sp. AB-rgal1 TaxID=3242696 RepID=UPI00359DA6DD